MRTGSGPSRSSPWEAFAPAALNCWRKRRKPGLRRPRERPAEGGARNGKGAKFGGSRGHSVMGINFHMRDDAADGAAWAGRIRSEAVVDREKQPQQLSHNYVHRRAA